MARAANAPSGPTDTQINASIRAIHVTHEEIESARGTYMNRARRLRERISAQVQTLVDRGANPKVVRLQVKIEQKLADVTKLMADLEAEERREAERFARARALPAQLALFAPTPAPRRTRAAAAPAAERPARQPRRRPGVRGDEIPATVTSLADARAAAS